MTLQQLRDSILVVGPPKRDPDWDSKWRSGLVDNLAVMVGTLRRVGVTEVYVDGSFCEEINHPRDIDGYFVCDRNEYSSGRLEASLNRIDPVWFWDEQYRRPDPKTNEMQLPMWHRYRVELWPDVGQPSGIAGPDGSSQTFSEAFRISRDFKARGIIRLIGEN